MMNDRKCKRLNVTAKAYINKADEHPIAMARNRPPLGEKCTKIEGNCGCSHAEENLLEKLTAGRFKEDIAHIHITHSPCYDCAVDLVYQLPNLKSVHFDDFYRKTDGIRVLMTNGIEVEHEKIGPIYSIESGGQITTNQDKVNKDSKIMKDKGNNPQLQTQNKKHDPVNHPSHYTNGDVECIDAIEAATKGLVDNEGYYTGSIIKYMWRWKYKNGVEDLEKAQWYLGKLIETQK